MTLPESKQPEETTPQVEPEKNLSARAGAESALHEYKTKLISKLTDEQAKDAFARLVVGRGFDRPKPAPVMTIHSAIVTGESKSEEAAPAQPEPQKQQRDYLRTLADFFRKRS